MLPRPRHAEGCGPPLIGHADGFGYPSLGWMPLAATLNSHQHPLARWHFRRGLHALHSLL